MDTLPKSLTQSDLSAGIEILENLNEVGIWLWPDGDGGLCANVTISRELRSTLHRHWAGLLCAVRAQEEARRAMDRAAKTAIEPPKGPAATRTPTKHRSRNGKPIGKPVGHSFDGGNAA